MALLHLPLHILTCRRTLVENTAAVVSQLTDMVSDETPSDLPLENSAVSDEEGL